MKKLAAFLCVMVLVFGVVGTANSALWDRGGGLIYDDVLNITWLQDANIASGRVFWIGANSLISNMNNTNYLGYNDWRLPHTLPVNGSSYNYFNGSSDGSTDFGYNVSAPGSIYAGSTGSEMAYMYYNNLGNLGYWDINGNYQPGYGLQNTSFESGGSGGPVVTFQNIQPFNTYWSGTEYAPSAGNQVWAFAFSNGSQGAAGIATENYVWPVRNGDVIPIPSAVLLVGFGFIGLSGFGRIFRKS